MDRTPETPAAPDWLFEMLDESDADLEAGRLVPLDDAIARVRATVTGMEEGMDELEDEADGNESGDDGPAP
jgi:hypothetical protein